MVTPKKSIALFLLLAAGLLLAEGVRLAWFNLGEPPWADEARLVYRVPPEAQLEDLEGSRASEMLSFDSATMVQLDLNSAGDARAERPEGLGADAQLTLIVLNYEAENSKVWGDVFNHSPEICLRGSGAVLLRTFRRKEVAVGGRQLVFRHLLFDRAPYGPPVHVFKMVWLAGMEEFGVRGDDNEFRLGHYGRFRAAAFRYMPHGTLTLAIVSGVAPDKPNSAWAVLRDHVEANFRFE